MDKIEEEKLQKQMLKELRRKEQRKLQKQLDQSPETPQRGKRMVGDNNQHILIQKSHEKSIKTVNIEASEEFKQFMRLNKQKLVQLVLQQKDELKILKKQIQNIQFNLIEKNDNIDKLKKELDQHVLDEYIHAPCQASKEAFEQKIEELDADLYILSQQQEKDLQKSETKFEKVQEQIEQILKNQNSNQINQQKHSDFNYSSSKAFLKKCNICQKFGHQ